MRHVHPAADLALWAEDDHRLGLLPVVRRVWAPRGRRPTAWVHRRCQRRSVSAFVRPVTGQSWWCLLPTVGAEAMALALAAFAADGGIDAAHRAVLVLDGAGGHTAGALVVPVGIDLVVLPPASPELQPVERVWRLLDEPGASRTFADLAERTEGLAARRTALRAARRVVKAHTRFPWWAKERRPRHTHL